MDLYEKNRRARENGAARIVEPIEEAAVSSVRVENLFGPVGHLTARVEVKDGNFVFMHSFYDPYRESTRLMERLDFAKHTLIFVFGLGLGYHLLEIQKQLSPFSQVWVIENDLEVIENAMHTVDLSGLFADRRFTFCLCLSDFQIIQFFRNTLAESSNFFLSSNPQYLRLNYFEQRRPGFVQTVIKACVEKLLYGWHALGNSLEDTIVGLAQNFYNFDVGIENAGVKLMENRYRDKPAILVAAGPSLDKNIDLLKEAQGKALIIACDVVVGKLLKHGIKPDIMVSLERVLVYEHCLKDRDWEIPPDMVFAGPLLLEPVVFSEFKNNKKLVCFKEGETINLWLNEIMDDKGSIYMGNSVAHVAFGLAIKLGANPVIFTGQDLAFGEDGATTHTGDLNNVISDLATTYTQEAQCVFLDGYYGGQVKSTMMWKTFKIAFENVIQTMKGNRTFIDATEGGAKIDGTVILPLREVIDRYCAEPIESFYDAVPVLKNVDKKYFYKKLLKSTREKVNLFERIRKAAEEHREVLVGFQDKYRDTYLSMDDMTRNKLCAALIKSEDIFRMLKDDYLTILIFQGVMSVFARKVINLGQELTNENLRKNLDLQAEFLDIVIDFCIVTLATFNNLQLYVKDLIAGKEEVHNYDNYLKIVVSQDTQTAVEQDVGVKVVQDLAGEGR